jgi:hypothetical protein
MLACRESFAHFSRHRDVVTSLALSFTDDHFEIGAALTNAPDLDHDDRSIHDSYVIIFTAHAFVGKINGSRGAPPDSPGVGALLMR